MFTLSTLSPLHGGKQVFLLFRSLCRTFFTRDSFPLGNEFPCIIFQEFALGMECSNWVLLPWQQRLSSNIYPSTSPTPSANGFAAQWAWDVPADSTRQFLAPDHWPVSPWDSRRAVSEPALTVCSPVWTSIKMQCLPVNKVSQGLQWRA